MDFVELINGMLAFFQANLLITIPLICVLLFLLYWKPRLFLIILFIVILLVGILYMIADVTSTGLSHKGKMIHKENSL
jgi:ABC-type bacteriocin/lantibiotic exporter with double-glycine peptidase domain